MKILWTTIFSLVVCSVGTSVSMLGQADRGVIRGQVHDEQNAATPGATLTLKNEATGVTASTVAQASGALLFPQPHSWAVHPYSYRHRFR